MIVQQNQHKFVLRTPSMFYEIFHVQYTASPVIHPDLFADPTLPPGHLAMK